MRTEVNNDQYSNGGHVQRVKQIGDGACNNRFGHLTVPFLILQPEYSVAHGIWQRFFELCYILFLLKSS